jgi:hypothetical protein
MRSHLMALRKGCDGAIYYDGFGAAQQASGDGGTIPPGRSPAQFSSSFSLTSARLYAMNLWNRGFFDVLDKRNTQQVLNLALLYFPLLVASVFLAVMQIYARMTFSVGGGRG